MRQDRIAEQMNLFNPRTRVERRPLCSTRGFLLLGAIICLLTAICFVALTDHAGESLWSFNVFGSNSAASLERPKNCEGATTLAAAKRTRRIQRPWKSNSFVQCVVNQTDARLRVPILWNTKVQVDVDVENAHPTESGQSGNSSSDVSAENVRVTLHFCGIQADNSDATHHGDRKTKEDARVKLTRQQIRERLAACSPFWTRFMADKGENSENGERQKEAGVEGGQMPKLILRFHSDSNVCLRCPQRSTLSCERSDDFLWLMARWGMDNQYHGLFEQGLFQTWVTYQDLLKAQVIPQHLLRSSRVPFVVVKDMFYKGHQPFQDLWPLALPSLHFEHLSSREESRNGAMRPPSAQSHTSSRTTWYCPEKLILSHYDYFPSEVLRSRVLLLNRQVGSKGWAVDADSDENRLTRFHTAVRQFAEEARRTLNHRFPLRYPPTPEGSPERGSFLIEDRPFTENAGAKSFFRARGLFPELKTELREAFEPFYGPPTTVRFSPSMSLEEQWRILQSKKVVVAAEGAFFAWSMFAAENSTWICIDNHTRSEGFGPVTSHYHANLALAYPWMRLIVYTIRHGHRAPISRLVDLVTSPFAPGVRFVDDQT